VLKNILEPDRPQVTISRMRFACWITKATDTHSEPVVLTDFPRQKWLLERASMLCYSALSVLLLNTKSCFCYFNNTENNNKFSKGDPALNLTGMNLAKWFIELPLLSYTEPIVSPFPLPFFDSIKEQSRSLS
jgi:hypothetical protein